MKKPFGLLSLILLAGIQAAGAEPGSPGPHATVKTQEDQIVTIKCEALVLSLGRVSTDTQVRLDQIAIGDRRYLSVYQGCQGRGIECHHDVYVQPGDFRAKSDSLEKVHEAYGSLKANLESSTLKLQARDGSRTETFQCSSDLKHSYKKFILNLHTPPKAGSTQD